MLRLMHVTSEWYSLQLLDHLFIPTNLALSSHLQEKLPFTAQLRPAIIPTWPGIYTAVIWLAGDVQRPIKADPVWDVLLCMQASDFYKCLQSKCMQTHDFCNWSQSRCMQAPDCCIWLQCRWASKQPLSILDGVPFAVKDGFNALPYPTTVGAAWVRHP